MAQHRFYQDLLEARQQGKKRLAVLLDPDKMRPTHVEHIADLAATGGVHYLFIGGSLVVNNRLDGLLTDLRARCPVPLVLFPGSSFQLSYRADAILLLSLISGRNPELLIGQHVIAAPFLKVSPLEIVSTGYMLIDGGVTTSVQYMSNTNPIPANKADIAVCTAMAGEMLGLKTLYLEAGSGAVNPVPEALIEAVRAAVDVPLLVGGGIRTAEKATANLRAGADVLVVGTAVEQDPRRLRELAAAVADFNRVITP